MPLITNRRLTEEEKSRDREYTVTPIQPSPELGAPEPKPSLLDTTVAALETYHPVTQLRRAHQFNKEYGFDYDPNFDPFADEAAMEHYPPSIFIHANSETDMHRMKAKYDFSAQQHNMISRSGGLGILSSVGAGIATPYNLIPLFGVASKASALRAAMSVGGQVAGIQAVEEAVTQGLNLDLARTAEQSAYNVIGAAVVGGVLGGTLKSLSNRGEAQLVKDNVEIQRLNEQVTKEIMDFNDFVGPRTPQSIIDFRSQLIPETGSITNPVMKLLAQATPMRLLTSKNAYARQLSVDLMEQSVVPTNGQAIETFLKATVNQHLMAGHTQLSKIFKEYKAAGGVDTRDAFKAQVARAMSNGDRAMSNYVSRAAKAYRSKVVDPLTRAAQEVGVLPAELVVKGAKSYLPRLQDVNLIRNNAPEFIDEMAGYFKNGSVELTTEQARDAAKALYNKLVSADRFSVKDSINNGFGVSLPGSTKARTLSLSDEQLRPWMIQDVEAVMNTWTREIAPHIELARRFGSSDLKIPVKQITDEYEAMIEPLRLKNDSRGVARIEKQMAADLRDLKALRDRLIGRYGQPSDPSSGWIQTSRYVRNVTTLASLGGMAVSALADLARPIYYHGFGKYTKGVGAMMSKDFRLLNRAEMERMGVAAENVLHNRVRSYVQADWGGNTTGAGARWMEDRARNFGSVAGMTQMNNFMKEFSGLLSSSGFLEMAENFSKNAAHFGRAGLDEDMVARILKEWKAHGMTKKGFRFGNSHEWTDFDAARAFEAAIIKEADTAIITPGIADRPLFMSTEMGKFFTQFQSFTLASNNRVLMPAISGFDSNVAQGLVASAMFGALSVGIKDALRGRDPQLRYQEDAMKANWDVMNQSGTLGLVGYVVDSFAVPALEASGTIESNFRPDQDSMVVDILGPGTGKAATAIDAIVNTDPYAARTLIPYNNLWQARMLFRAMEAGGAEIPGVTRIEKEENRSVR